jgi:hypothetical protein
MAGMTDSLRDRIAELLYGNAYVGDADRYEIADAIIQGLGLKREGTDPEQIIGHGYPPLHRYVTEWTTDA